MLLPIISSADDLDEGIEYADREPSARWYVAKKAKALGVADMIPESWSDQPVIQAAAALVAAAERGEDISHFRAELLAQARSAQLLQHPTVVAAVNWREWLHPRGKDGQFMEKFSLVDIFADSKAPLDSPTARKKRGRISAVSPEGIRISYSNADGTDAPPEPDQGFPEIIPTDEISDKVTLAPESVARFEPEPEPEPLPEPRDPAEVAAQWQASPEAAEWQRRVAEFNRSVDTSRSANSRGDKLRDAVDYKEIDFSGTSTVPEMFATVRDTQDPAFTAHQSFVAETMDAAAKAGLNSESVLKVSDEKDAAWAPETTAYINAVVAEMLADLDARGVPKQRRSPMLGGLPGAGKSSLVKAYGLDMSKWAVANPDDVKDILIRDGVYPKIDGIAPLETAGPIHELSSTISHEFSDAVMAHGYNMISDITMGGKPKKKSGMTGAQETARDLTDLGYTVDAVFVDVPLSMSATSQNQRHLHGVNKLRTGEEEAGGRFVPEFILEGSDIGEGDNNSQNLKNFTEMRDSGAFTRWYMLDNTGYDTMPLLIGRGTDRGRKPKFRRFKENGRVRIVLLEDPADIPGMYPEDAAQLTQPSTL